MIQSIVETTGAFLAEQFYLRSSQAGRLHPFWSPQAQGLHVIRDVAYTDSKSKAHTLDIYRPKKAPAKMPVVFYVHGGGFRILSKESHWVMAQTFARAGYLVFNINYRLSDEAPFPAAIEDTMQAYLWVLKNAAQYSGFVDNGVILAGDSAGGNLVTSLALAHVVDIMNHHLADQVFHSAPLPKAVLPGCGLFQVTKPERFYEHSNSLFLPVLEYFARHYISNADTENNLMPLIDPLLFLEQNANLKKKLPPFFILAGGIDPIRHDSQRLHEALKTLGATSRLKIYPNRHHAFHAFHQLDPMARLAWEHKFRFLRGL